MTIKQHDIAIMHPMLDKIAECVGLFLDSRDRADDIDSLDWDELCILAALLDGLTVYVCHLLEAD